MSRSGGSSSSSGSSLGLPVYVDVTHSLCVMIIIYCTSDILMISGN